MKISKIALIGSSKTHEFDEDNKNGLTGFCSSYDKMIFRGVRYTTHEIPIQRI